MIDIQPVHRRAVLRHAVALQCECVHEGPFRSIRQMLLDLSPDGAFIKTDERDVALGEDVWLTFQIPKGDVLMDAHARVVRYGRESFRGDHVRGLGIQFVDLSRADRDRLEQSLSALPPPVPSNTRPMDYASFVRHVDYGVAESFDRRMYM